MFFYDNDYLTIKDFYVRIVDMICICLYMFIGATVFPVALSLKIQVLPMLDYYTLAQKEKGVYCFILVCLSVLLSVCVSLCP